MKAITPEDLQEWLEEQANWQAHKDDPPTPGDPYSGPEFDRWVAEQEHQERAFMATLNARQMLDYLVYLGVLGDECPRCHTKYVEVSSFEFPDMVGTTYGETWECCGYTWDRSSALIYNDRGEPVDIR